ncbi:2-dehydropantoate 2-reductase [Marinitenerispora sediminis]|uniref:2-dehydropantoate 2-reductase n=1 Tax=Marinitenerispora sediminis TaxID=1931232 RepID=A0A368TBI4_9ACTN|nr:2-dehydropantoate 2-reductase [Marinitenerispora sediminis]RCV50434.1 2-dehydropantoate 2-reductase [Marinitenerispora sediminis]RCV55321.1 2-dehydropantoate 2-reductase [Marinitenerispora sediminis]RCV62509.1 2-dehydropantoate 2-reductase [Marinitenerispora sediminis]
MTESTTGGLTGASGLEPLERPQRVAVVGAGAIGGIVAEAAHTAGHHVTLCVRRPMGPLTVERDGLRRTVRLPVATRPDGLGAPVDWLLIATKAQDTRRTLGWIRRLAGPGTRVVVLQNGVDHEERLAPLLAVGELVPALVYIAAERVSREHVQHRWGRRLVVPSGPAGADLGRLFRGSDVDVVCEDDFTTAAWRKLMTNLAANPLTALTLRRIGVLQQPDLRELARGLLTEAVLVGRAEGARLVMSDVDQTLDLYSAMHPHSGTSMLYDRLAGRPVEHDLITGAVVRAADRHEVPVPLNRAVLALLRAFGEQGAVGVQPLAGVG